MRHANWPTIPAVRLRQTALSQGLCLALGCTGSFAYAQAIPAPGALITNVASGDFIDRFGNLQVINSNPVELVVSEVRAVQLVRNQEQIGLIGGQISYPHTLTNTGNVADSYALSAIQLGGDNFDLLNLALYVDRNQDGVPDDNINLLQVGNLIALQAGESVALVAAAAIPADRTNADRADFTLTATSQAVPTLTSTVTDITRVTNGGVLAVNKTQSLATGTLGSVITYTLRYSNTGNAAAELRLTDVLDVTRFRYIDDSGRWSNSGIALTEEAGEDPANSAVNYQVTTTASQHQMSVVIPSVPAQSTGSISFQVEVISAPSGRVSNTANYQQVDGVTIVKDTSTNTVTFTVQANTQVVLNNNSLAAVNGGNPSAAPDNLVSVASAAAGVETLFNNYVWNTGNQIDSFNLSFVTANLPACATVRLYAADGKTLLTDSNGDGIIDTGAMQPSTSRNIKVGISSTQDCVTATPISIDVTATSSNNPSISDPIRNQLGAITQGGTDLYNSDNSGTGNPNTDNAGAAFISKPILPAGTAVFPLVVRNTGTLINNYQLIADDDGTLDPVSNSNDLPAGWSVKFFAQLDPTCTTLGDEISNSGAVPANGGTVGYCAVVTAPAGAAPQDFPIWFAVRSPVNGQTDILKDQVQVQAARLLSLQADNQGQVTIGGTVVYTHTLTNVGNVTEGTAAGNLLIALDGTNANSMLGTVYYDANNNGVLDAGDPIATDVAALGATNGAIGLAPNESIRLFVKVEAPSTLTNGASSSFVLSATPVGLIAGMAAVAVSNTDVTVVSANQVRLQKMQALDATCDGTPDTAYAMTALAIAPAQCVFYQITAINDGATAVSNVIVSDRIPAYTRLRGTPVASPGTLTKPTAPIPNPYQGDVEANLGTLPPSQSATLRFAIRVDPVN